MSSSTAAAAILQPDPTLEDGARVAVIGSGPAGSLFSHFLLEMSERITNLSLDIYESRNFLQPGPTGCNMCGGIVSETLVQNLAIEGVTLPAGVVQRGIQSYVLHTDAGSARIETPLAEMRIGAMHRGAGPRDAENPKWESFDHHLQARALADGAHLVRKRVEKISRVDGKPTIHTKCGSVETYDLLVVAAGVNSPLLEKLEELGIGYERPAVTKTLIREYHLGEAVINRSLGTAMHVFLLDIPRLEFAAAIPKGDYVTMAVLGEDIDDALMQTFLAAPEVRGCMPPGWDPEARSCQCMPKISVRGAAKPYADRVVFIGDCGVTRLYKDGIGAAYRTAKAAARTALFEGVSEQAFERRYLPVCRSIAKDNRIGEVAFLATRIRARVQAPAARHAPHGGERAGQARRPATHERRPLGHVLRERAVLRHLRADAAPRVPREVRRVRRRLAVVVTDAAEGAIKDRAGSAAGRGRRAHEAPGGTRQDVPGPGGRVRAGAGRRVPLRRPGRAARDRRRSGRARDGGPGRRQGRADRRDGVLPAGGALGDGAGARLRARPDPRQEELPAPHQRGPVAGVPDGRDDVAPRPGSQHPGGGAQGAAAGERGRRMKAYSMLLRVTVAVSCAAGLFTPLATWADTQEAELDTAGIAKVVSVQGTVESQRTGEAQWRPVKLDETYSAGDTIRVAQRSRADVALLDQSVLRLNENSSITIQPIKGRRTGVIDLLKGAVHFFSRGPESLVVNTPFTVAGVRGTEFLLEVEPERTLLSTFEGTVVAENAAGSVTVTGGQSAVAERGKAPLLRVVARPRDAVQWALYYPTVVNFRPSEFPAGSDWKGLMRQSIEAYERGDLTGGFASIVERASRDRHGPALLHLPRSPAADGGTGGRGGRRHRAGARARGERPERARAPDRRRHRAERAGAGAPARADGGRGGAGVRDGAARALLRAAGEVRPRGSAHERPDGRSSSSPRTRSPGPGSPSCTPRTATSSRSARPRAGPRR